MIDVKTARNFGFILAGISTAIALYPILFNEKIRVLFLLIAIAFVLISFFVPRYLILPTKLWIKFGEIMGLIVSPIVLGAVFFLVVYPTSIIVKIFNKDIINQNLDKHLKSYWIKRKKSDIDYKDQF